MSDWTVVIPVKGTVAAKSRLGASFELAQAIALDTVEAALGAASVIVVTAASAGAPFAQLGARVLADASSGLDAAVRQGIAAAGSGPVAVLLGDVPALRSEELADALGEAARHPLSFVPDADGIGTVLIAATAASAHRPRFGGASRELHLAEGYVELTVDAGSGLRRDVDTAEQLRALGERVGVRTRAVVSGVAARETLLAAGCG